MIVTHLDQLRGELALADSPHEVLRIQQTRCPGGVYPSRRNRAAQRAVSAALQKFSPKKEKTYAPRDIDQDE